MRVTSSKGFLPVLFFLFAAFFLSLSLGRSAHALSLDASGEFGMCADEVYLDEAMMEQLLNDDGYLDEGLLNGMVVEDAILEFPQECDYRLDEEIEQDPQEKPKPIEITLVRQCCGTECIIGELKMGDDQICRTLELPWNGNERNKSCIPPGDYVCKRVNSPKFGWTYEITNVKGRTHILIHKGNWPKNTSGCVLVGMGADVEKNMITKSKVAFDKLMKTLDKCKEFKLKIVDKTKKEEPKAPIT